MKNSRNIMMVVSHPNKNLVSVILGECIKWNKLHSYGTAWGLPREGCYYGIAVGDRRIE